MLLWRLASSKSIGPASALETQAGFLMYHLEAESFLLQKTSVLLFRPSTDWVWPTHILENNVFY